MYTYDNRNNSQEEGNNKEKHEEKKQQTSTYPGWHGSTSQIDCFQKSGPKEYKEYVKSKIMRMIENVKLNIH